MGKLDLYGLFFFCCFLYPGFADLFIRWSGRSWRLPLSELLRLCWGGDGIVSNVRCVISINGWGLHILASEDPIQIPPPAHLLARIPDNAEVDLLEWSQSKDILRDMDTVFSHEIAVQDLLGPNPAIQITDDDPMNEYYLLRRLDEYYRRPQYGHL